MLIGNGEGETFMYSREGQRLQLLVRRKQGMSAVATAPGKAHSKVFRPFISLRSREPVSVC